MVFFFLQFYEPPDLGKKIFTIWNVLKSEVYLTCINFWKFHDDLKAGFEVIRHPSWPENVEFSVKCIFYVFDPLKNLFLNEWQIWNLVFLKVNLEVFTFIQNQYFYLSFQTFKGTLKTLQNTFCSQIQQEKSLKLTIKSELHRLCSWNFWDFLFSMRLPNGENFKDFKIFDLTWIWWIWLEWPYYFYLLRNHVDTSTKSK